MIEPFADSYFEHYAFFDEKEKTEYTDIYNHVQGNLNVHQTMLSFFRNKFGRLPKNYFDLGCGTGDEMAYMFEKGIKVAGCDISPYVLSRKNKKVATCIHEVDSITFLKSTDEKAEMILDSTLQYIDNKEFYELLELIVKHASNKCVFGIIYDETPRKHPYRKQLRSEEQWINIVGSKGFQSAKDEVKDLFLTNGNKISSLISINIGKYIFIKE